MTDNELKRLKDLPVPAPRAAAKADALAAALAAFDTGAHAAETSEEKISGDPQGNVVPLRHTHASPQTQRSRLMRVTPTHYKIAASITVLLIAAPLAYHIGGLKPAEEIRGQTPVVDAVPQPPVRNLQSNDTAGNDGACCGDLEKRVAELEAAIARKGSLQMNGQVNKGLLIWDDSIDSDAFVVDNQLSSSRVGFKGKATIKPGSTAGYSMEFEVGGGDTGKTAQKSEGEAAGVPIRQSQAVVESDKYGRINIGDQPATSTEKVANLDASGPKQLQSRLTPAPAEQLSGARSDTKQAPNQPPIPEVSEVAPATLSVPSTSGPSAPPPAKPVLSAPRDRVDSANRIARILVPKNEQAKSRAPERKQAETRVATASQPKPVIPPMKTKDAAGVPETERDYFLPVDDDEFNNKFETAAPNPVKQVAAEPVSTFSTDVDTASYAYVRRALNSGHLPPKDSVRVEELINYFPYVYPRPDAAEAPFQPTVTVTPAPWNAAHKLMHIGIKGYELNATSRPRANLVFLIDVSGSMASADKLPLVKNAFRMLLDELQPDDTVGIVTYASGTGVALEPTRVRNKQKILDAIDRLGAGGSTAGAQGIQDAYHLAEGNFDKAAVNRIILATDGDFNVGITNQDELKGFIERKRQSGIFLSILGVGEGNYNDSLMQKLAQNGNGTAAYVDTLNEARKVLVDEASSTLFTIAKDVKIQIEFNPAMVSEYRLIGYETRALKREDFNNDKVDAGDIGSGHTVTAIYEITPVGAPKLVDDLRYGKPDAKAAAPAPTGQPGEYAFLKMRYKLPNEDTSKLITQPVGKESEKPSIDAAPEDVRFSVAVAAFGQMLRGLPYLQNYSYDDVVALAQGARGPDNFGYRSEFVNLVRLAKSARP